jgi:hypothetical protein
MCGYLRSFPMLERVHAVEGGGGSGAELLDSLRRAKPTLHAVSVISGSLYSKWTADAQKQRSITVDDHEYEVLQ